MKLLKELEEKDITILFNPIFLRFNIAEETQKDALEIFQNIIEKQEKLLDKVSLFATCLLYCVHRQKNCVKISIQKYCKILQEQSLEIIPRIILRDMLKFNNYMKLYHFK